MRICMIGQKGIPSRAGGVEIHVEEIGKRLVAMGHDVTVYCRKSYVADEKPLHEGICLRYMPTINTKHLDAITYTFFATMDGLFSGQQVFHYHALGPSVLSFIPKMFGKKVVCTVHGLDWQREKWGNGAKKFLKLGEYVITKAPDRVISVSRSLQKYFSDKYGMDTEYITNGVILPEIIPCNDITEKFGLKERDYILFLARLVPEKGAHYLIEAFKQLKTDKRLVIAGGSSHSDEYVQELHALADGDERILFTGFISGRILEELYSNAYLYVLPSEIEGLPISLLEAMSYEQCCLVSNIPENLEAIDEYGLSFESKNPNDLQIKLSDLINNPEDVTALKKRAREHVMSQYNWDEITQKTHVLYSSLASTSRRIESQQGFDQLQE